jgi:hypothetical protein
MSKQQPPPPTTLIDTATATLPSLTGVLLAFIPLLFILGLWVSSLFSDSVANFVYKLHLLRIGVLNLALSKDKKWKKPVGRPESIKKTTGKSKRIVFLRHGESQWNIVFNKGINKTFPGRLGNALKNEINMLTTLDSIFVDSPLSALGAEQALEAQEFIEHCQDEEWGPILQGRSSSIKSILCASNLRRALSTGTIAFWQRMKRTQERMHILSSLQEVTFNIDGVALAKPHSAPLLANVEMEALHVSRKDFNPERYFDASRNDGDKPISGKGIDRMLAFAKWSIAAGHSLYFRFFFQTFLPTTSSHQAKKDKMANGALVAFTLSEGIDQGSGKIFYVIDEESIKVLHNGFEGKEHGKKHQ